MSYPKSRRFPGLHEILEFLNERPWMPPESRGEASIRVLTALGQLPSWDWSKLHYQVAIWYDKCRELLEKNQELLYYPELVTTPLTPEQLFTRGLEGGLTTRIMELLLAEYTIEVRRLKEILAFEGRISSAATIGYALNAGRRMLAVLHRDGHLDLNKLYKSGEQK